MSKKMLRFFIQSGLTYMRAPVVSYPSVGKPRVLLPFQGYCEFTFSCPTDREDLCDSSENEEGGFQILQPELYQQPQRLPLQQPRTQQEPLWLTFCPICCFLRKICSSFDNNSEIRHTNSIKISSINFCDMCQLNLEYFNGIQIKSFKKTRQKGPRSA